jgi:GDP-L-fucose synthase
MGAGLAGATVVVTGGTGFLGRHVAMELARAGARVAALGRSDYDLRHRDETERMLRTWRPDAVIHLAAVVGGIEANREEPGRFFYENAVMGIELIEQCRQVGVGKVLLAGTVCAYPGRTAVPFDEANLWDGYPEETNAPYAMAKKVLLVQAQAYRRQYGMNIGYLLPANLYGPGDSNDLRAGHVIPALIRRFTDARDTGGRTVELWGDGTPTRDFLYVEDAARAFRLALERYDGAEPVNIGTGRETSIRDVAALIAGIVGFTGAVTWDVTRPNGQARRRLGIDRARDRLGYTATTRLEDGLRRTVAWYERHRNACAS